ncbi:hypothetical protein D7W82_07260 [Corallococcus sp. CA049B]|uniref:hypothetical protein n=1 Tax=Corallococcus sp. CA049B TaxID=2316730 RepID=UPI000EA0AE6C|nr:hypothetical protein [Corallococcus sp. CA049B]RKG89333.1 hypothetical protein D7W82_07260 [Corallococcus sp. CA049B]
MSLDLSEFQKTYVYETRAPVAEVLEDLKALGKLDARAERKRILMGIGSFVSMCLGISFAVLSQWLLSAALFATSIVLFILWIRSKHTDLDNRRYGLVAALLQRFQVDLDANAPVDVKLDLAPEDAERKCVGKRKRGRWDSEDFTDAWLSLHGRFADGTHLHLSVVEHVQKRKRYGRGSSGKTKLKTKRKGKTLLQVGLRVKPERFPGLTALEARARNAVKLPPGARVKRVRVAEDRVELRVLLDEGWVARGPKVAEPSESLPGRSPSKTDASRAVTMMLLSLYQVLNYSSSRGQPGNVRSLP